MRIILSRKGFDTSTGKRASPIFPDGTMVSLPIPASPSDGATLTYGDLFYHTRNGRESVGELLEQLKATISPSDPVHLDPDLSVNSRPRKEGWRPLFGQHHSSEAHLQNQGVGTGDVFLFFGMFRKVIRSGGRWRYVPGSKKMHVLFGWLQIEERVPASDWPSGKPWALDHPHLQDCFIKTKDRHNVVYVSTERLSLPGLD